jgi:hypothetical protein
MPQPPDSRNNGTLIQPHDDEQREVMTHWRRVESGMDGERGQLPETPDDAVAYKLLEAADDAMSRGDWQKGVNILRLIVKDYRQSQEAACARSVIDRLAKEAGGR